MPRTRQRAVRGRGRGAHRGGQDRHVRPVGGAGRPGRLVLLLPRHRLARPVRLERLGQHPGHGHPGRHQHHPRPGGRGGLRQHVPGLRELQRPVAGTPVRRAVRPGHRVLPRGPGGPGETPGLEDQTPRANRNPRSQPRAPRPGAHPAKHGPGHPLPPCLVRLYKRPQRGSGRQPVGAGRHHPRPYRAERVRQIHLGQPHRWPAAAGRRDGHDQRHRPVPPGSAYQAAARPDPHLPDRGPGQGADRGRQRGRRPLQPGAPDRAQARRKTPGSGHPALVQVGMGAWAASG